MQYTAARELRKKLSTFLDADHPTIIGSEWKPRAILVPIARGPSWSWPRRPSPIVKAQRAALDTLRKLRQELRR